MTYRAFVRSLGHDDGLKKAIAVLDKLAAEAGIDVQDDDDYPAHFFYREARARLVRLQLEDLKEVI